MSDESSPPPRVGWGLITHYSSLSQVALVEDPDPPDAELDQGEREDDQEEYPGQRGRVAHLQAFPRLAIEIEHVEERRVRRTALGHDERRVEDLNGPDDRDDHAEEHHRTEHREGNEAKPVPPVGTVNRRGFVERVRHALEPGEEDDHLRA